MVSDGLTNAPESVWPDVDACEAEEGTGTANERVRSKPDMVGCWKETETEIEETRRRVAHASYIAGL
jgi:hypothetical protein